MLIIENLNTREFTKTCRRFVIIAEPKVRRHSENVESNLLLT